jgi:hypothetical protein
MLLLLMMMVFGALHGRDDIFINFESFFLIQIAILTSFLLSLRLCFQMYMILYFFVLVVRPNLVGRLTTVHRVTTQEAYFKSATYLPDGSALRNFVSITMAWLDTHGFLLQC